MLARALRWTEGLPAFDVEAQPLRLALSLWRPAGAVDWNPHFFVYPSLSIYFHLALQWIQLVVGSALGTYTSVADFLLAFESDPGAHVLLARGAVTALDLATIVGTVVLGERLTRGAGIVAGLVVAFSPTGLETSRALYADALLAACTVWAVERMDSRARRGTAGTLAAAAALTGLAAGCKYPGLLLALPLALVAAVSGRGGVQRRAGRVVAALFGAGLVFALTSPFLLLDANAAIADLRFVGDLAQRGHLGNLDRNAAGYYAALLARDPGLVVLALAALAPFVARREAGACRSLSLLLLAAAPLLATVAASSVIAPRYVVPVTPLLAIGAAVAALLLLTRASRLPAPARLALAGAMLAGPLVPDVVGALGRPLLDTRDRALAWCADSLPATALVFRESGGPPLLSRARRDLVLGSWTFQRAGGPARARYRGRRTFNDVAWPLFVHGELRAPLASAGVAAGSVQVFPEAVDFTAAFYDLRLLALADYMITSGVVRTRYEADTARFAIQHRAYAALDREADLVARFTPRDGRDGPDLRVYRIGPGTRAAWKGGRSPLGPAWWTEYVPPNAQIRRVPGPVLRDALAAFHDRHVAPTLNGIASGLERAGRANEGTPFGAAGTER